MIAEQSGYTKATASDGLHVRTAPDERDGLAVLRKQSAEHASDRPGAHNQDLHRDPRAEVKPASG